MTQRQVDVGLVELCCQNCTESNELIIVGKMSMPLPLLLFYTTIQNHNVAFTIIYGCDSMKL